jgi:hypothetical protein
MKHHMNRGTPCVSCPVRGRGACEMWRGSNAIRCGKRNLVTLAAIMSEWLKFLADNARSAIKAASFSPKPTLDQLAFQLHRRILQPRLVRRALRVRLPGPKARFTPVPQTRWRYSPTTQVWPRWLRSSMATLPQHTWASLPLDWIIGPDTNTSSRSLEINKRGVRLLNRCGGLLRSSSPRSFPNIEKGDRVWLVSPTSNPAGEGVQSGQIE